jgi:pimeloyl-ACP methyl ester carboxylesterase
MTRAAMTFLCLLFLPVGGCACKPDPQTTNVIFLLPGVAGETGNYHALEQAIAKSSGAAVQKISWGAPSPLFILSFSNKRIHDNAEEKLAKAIRDWRAAHPTNQIDLIGHSAGCGVILGALKRLPSDLRARTVVLLAPSVSPIYDLSNSLAQIDGKLHIFNSPHDTFFLKWRTGHFGTYDNIKTIAAGNRGFDLSTLSPELRAKVIAHPYEEPWKQLDNDGGHFGALSQPFAEAIIAPFFASPSPGSASPSR